MRAADTDPVAQQVQLDLLRAASVSQRVALACSLSDLVLQLARRAIEQAHPTASPDELAVRFVTRCYGPELGEGLRAHLAARQQGRGG